MSKTKSTIVLTLVCIITAALLAGTYMLTKDKIASQSENALTESLKEIIPDADKFIEETSGDTSYFIAIKDNIEAGYATTGEAQGYGGIIKTLVGVDLEGNILGVRILEQSETPGLGDKAKNPGFYNQFNNQKKNSIRLSKEGGSIDAITGATITSRAVIASVNDALATLSDAVGIQQVGEQ
ncbi:RnfABCDGE type electron transport complex subunit G [Candidatus Woesearchaeota archaeon]|nr:RnfABCDGE type electron transport complex subunit G [Candidatus Woesearchaeota archaeon]